VAYSTIENMFGSYRLIYLSGQLKL